jgi:hypothetical protein
MMALWRLVETALGRSTDPKSQGAPSEVLDRVKAFALAVVYFSRSRTPRSDSPGAPGSPPVTRMRGPAHA